MNRISILLVLQLQEYKSLTIFNKIFLNNVDSITFFMLTEIYMCVRTHAYTYQSTGKSWLRGLP